MEPITPAEPVAGAAIRIDSHLDADERTLAEDVLDGLTRPFKELPPKHFYDSRGAQLFDRICELPEYYPTRAERAILTDSAEELSRLTNAAELVELGSGSASKTRGIERGTVMSRPPVHQLDSCRHSHGKVGRACGRGEVRVGYGTARCRSSSPPVRRMAPTDRFRTADPTRTG